MQKKEYILGKEEETSREGALEPGAAEGALGLFLLPAGRPGRRFTRAEDGATAVAETILFLLPRGRPRPRFSTGAPRFKRDPLASAWRQKLEKETLDEFKGRKMVQRKS
jgi:hypothetical protein